MGRFVQSHLSPGMGSYRDCLADPCSAPSTRADEPQRRLRPRLREPSATGAGAGVEPRPRPAPACRRPTPRPRRRARRGVRPAWATGALRPRRHAGGSPFGQLPTYRMPIITIQKAGTTSSVAPPIGRKMSTPVKQPRMRHPAREQADAQRAQRHPDHRRHQREPRQQVHVLGDYVGGALRERLFDGAAGEVVANREAVRLDRADRLVADGRGPPARSRRPGPAGAPPTSCSGAGSGWRRRAAAAPA